MSAVGLSPEELIKAFNKYMPKRPNYPPLVPDDDILSNSNTDSDGSDDEHEDINKRMIVSVTFNTVMTSECRTAWFNSTCKSPGQYLDDNIKRDLEIALQKLVNLKLRPNNPIEWLGYCLMNMNIKDPRPPSKDHTMKPSGAQLDCVVDANINPIACGRTLHIQRPTVIFENYGVRERSSSGKRKIGEQ